MGNFNLCPRGTEYFKRVLSTEPANLIAYWPLDEAVGSVARDLSPNKFHGASTGVTLGVPGVGDGRTAYSFDGSTDYVNVYSTGLASAFNGAEGTLLVWAKVANAGVWTENTTPYRIVTLSADASNYVDIQKYLAGRLVFEYGSGGTALSRAVTGLSSLSWMSTCLTWSESQDEVRAHLDGAQQGATITGLGTWAGSLASTTTVIGAASTSATWPWSGSLAHCALWSKALTAAQIAYLSKM